MCIQKEPTKRTPGRALIALLIAAIAGGPSALAGDIARETRGGRSASAKSNLETVIELNPDAAAAAGIVVEPITERDLPRLLQAPGEVRLDDYRSAVVTTRVAAQVVSRHARLDDTVKAGQRLVTLTSVEVADAQGDAQVNAREWARVQELGEAIAGGRRYAEARIAIEQAQAKLIAYGLNPTESAVGSRPLGQFALLAPRDGTIMRDAFIEGERIEPGRELFFITDESTVWVEASLAPADERLVRTGAAAQVRIDGNWRAARVVQKHHQLDEKTRSIPVRIELIAPQDDLHAGEYVDCRIEIGQIQNALAVPDGALYKGTDGEWAVFVQEEETRYRRVKVSIAEKLGDETRIEGIAPGAKVVMQGAFLLNSELTKGSFEDED